MLECNYNGGLKNRYQMWIRTQLIRKKTLCAKYSLLETKSWGFNWFFTTIYYWFAITKDEFVITKDECVITKDEFVIDWKRWICNYKRWVSGGRITHKILPLYSRYIYIYIYIYIYTLLYTTSIHRHYEWLARFVQSPSLRQRLGKKGKQRKQRTIYIDAGRLHSLGTCSSRHKS